MPTRALVVAIENYGLAQGLTSRVLTGTHDTARSFMSWLVDVKGAAAGDIYVCSDDPHLAPTSPSFDATADQLGVAIKALVGAGAGSTNELYVLFSGHGLQFVEDDARRWTDVIVMREFEVAAESGRACIALDKLRRTLQVSLGDGDHYYFIDACRNPVSSGEMELGTLGYRLPTVPGDPSFATLFSTSRGEVAAVASGYGTHLVQGLTGWSRAKRWDGPRMAVFFDSLEDFMIENMTRQHVDVTIDGSSVRRILEIAPIPRHTCTLSIANATDADQFTLVVTNARGQALSTTAFAGASSTFVDVPDDYFVTIRHSDRQVEPPGAVPVDLFEDREVRFTLTDLADDGGGGGGGDGDGGGGGTRIAVRNVGVADVLLERIGDPDMGLTPLSADPLSVDPGRYHVRVVDPSSGELLRGARVDIPLGSDILDVDGWITPALGTAATSLMTYLPDEVVVEGFDLSFSETVGPIADRDLAVWLAIIGASRIVSDPTAFSKLRDLPLLDLSAAAPGGAPTYVLAGLDAADELLLGTDATAGLVRAAAVEQIPGVFQAFLPGVAGHRALAIGTPGRPPTTFVSRGFENRVTLVILTRDESRQLVVNQFVLPIARLTDALPPFAHTQFDWQRSQRSILDSVRFMAQAQRRFTRHVEVRPTGGDELYWQALLDGRWVDPITSLVCAYELIRRDQLQDLPTVLSNLADLDPQSPDLIALRGFSNAADTAPVDPPLFLEGAFLAGSEQYEESSWGRLDYRGPWTAWRGSGTAS